MAGASNIQLEMDIEEWEHRDSEQNPPPHLLAEDCYNEQHFVTFTNHQEDRSGENRKRKCMRSMESKLRALVTACMFMMSNACTCGSRPKKH